MRALLFSNSKNPNEPYLAHTLEPLRRMLKPGARVAFVPFAAVTLSWAEYLQRVRGALASLPLHIDSLAEADNPRALIRSADCIMVGGGNTFRLLYELRTRKLLVPIRQAVRSTRRTYGATYVGWSAGANIACPTICTTNDMPIIDPGGFGALDLVPFQINPHFTRAHPPGHQGETRVQRIKEYVALHPQRTVLGLPEGTWLEIEGALVRRCGPHEIVEFKSHSGT